MLDITDPTAPELIDSIDVKNGDTTLGAANSVAAFDGVVAVAVEGSPKTNPGIVAFYEAETLAKLGSVSVGALPDMLTFTPDGSKVLVANEGEPRQQLRRRSRRQRLDHHGPDELLEPDQRRDRRL